MGTILFVKHNLSSTEVRANHGLDIATTEILDTRSKSGAESVNYLYLPLRYGVAVVSVAVALGIKLLLDSLFIANGFLPSILGATMLSTSILLSAWYGGLGGRPGERAGLTSMRDRVTLLSGSLQIRSEPGVGTSVVAEVPLPATGDEKEANDEG